MKKSYLATFAVLLTVSAYSQQWTGSTNDSGLISRSGDVSIAAGNALISDVGYDRAAMDLFDQDDSEYLRLYSSTSDGYLRVQGVNPGALRFFPGNSETVHFAANGNVGIGTTVPEGIIHTKSNDWGLVYQSSSTINKRMQFFFRDKELNQTGRIGVDISGTNDDDLQFVAGAGSAPQLHIESDGKVGFGTTQPKGHIHIRSGNDEAIVIGDGGSESNSRRNSITFTETNQGSGDNGIRWLDGTGNVMGAIYGSATGGDRFVIGTVNKDIVLNTGSDLLRLTSAGKVGIGTANPDEKLTVKGKIHTEEVRVDLSVPGPDYVFEEDYPLASIEEIEAFIQFHNHLPEVPSAAEMEANGVQLGEMNMLLLKKIEELTLYTIEQEKEIQQLKADNGQKPNAKSLEEKIEELTLYLIELERKNNQQDLLIHKLLNQNED